MSIKSNKELSKVIMPNNEVISIYNVVKQKFTPQEKLLFTELRENLVDLAIFW